MTALNWWPWGHREPSPMAEAEAEDAERTLNEARRRKADRAHESYHQLRIAERLRAVTTENNFSAHIERLYER